MQTLNIRSGNQQELQSISELGTFDKPRARTAAIHPNKQRTQYKYAKGDDEVLILSSK